MKATHFLALIAATLWSAVLLLGFDGIEGVRSQNVPGFPSAGQLRYYMHVPAGVLALGAITWALALRWRVLRALAVVVAIVALICLPCYLVYYTGGV